MKKKVIITGCILVTVILGIIGVMAYVLISRGLSFEGSTTITSGGRATTTYTAGKFLDEAGKKLEDYYTAANTIDLTVDAGSVSIQKISNALVKLEEVNSFNTAVDNLQGKGAKEYQSAISTWYSSYKTLLKDNARFIAERIDESGKPKNSNEITAINEKLTELNTRGAELTREINIQGEAFYEANY